MLHFVIALLALMQARARPDLQLMKTEVVDDCRLVAEHYWSPSRPDGKRELWLRATDSRGRVLLTTYDRNADTLFSPDCSVVALNDHLGSDVSEVRLFARAGVFVYRPLSNSDLSRRVWERLLKTYGIDRTPRFLMHHYVEVLAWSSDSTALLLRAWGHTDSDNHVGAWFCVYDLRREDLSTDLGAMNRGTVVVDGHAKN